MIGNKKAHTLIGSGNYKLTVCSHSYRVQHIAQAKNGFVPEGDLPCFLQLCNEGRRAVLGVSGAFSLP
jgi:hypothetical protein